ncbi:MAG: hypothetical protein HXY40_12820 [Chloroflexi bacterium]|nr:hypothetical protein [Chloroflexota bacterium]
MTEFVVHARMFGKQDSGQLRVMGIDPARDGRRLRDLIGVQLQMSGMPDNITLREAMKLFYAYHHAAPRFELLERRGVQEKFDTQYALLSGGQKRRLALALLAIAAYALTALLTLF